VSDNNTSNIQSAIQAAPALAEPAAAPKPARKKRKRSKLELFFIAFFAAGVISLASLVFIFIRYGVDLPDYVALAEYRPPITSRFYAGDGSLLTEYATERRIFVELDDMPPNLINAFISAEDKNFWTHHGFDILGIIRATIGNVSNKLFGVGRVGGASTITQQVAKNFFLSSERSMSRKIREAILALKMERTFTKRHILTLYMNQIFLGYRSYGVAAAAANYFGKSLGELTLAEGAFLAALPKAPGNYNPITNKARAVARRDWVLERMFANGYITREEMRAAQEEDLVVNERLMSRAQRNALYFSEEVRKFLADIYGEEELYSGGLAVRTTIDPNFQDMATVALRKALLQLDRRGGWRGAEENLAQYITDGDFTAAFRRSEISSGMEDDGWRRAIITSVSPERAAFVFRNAEEGELSPESLAWARGALRFGDVVFVQRNAAGAWGLQQVPQVSGAMIAMNPHTGRVYAMVGGFSYWQSKFNRATQALRQPGSTIKPFVYLPALESGRFTPASILLDTPIVMDRESGEQWRPENYDDVFEGEITLRRAFEKSKNIPSIRVALDIGIRRFIRTAVDFGVYRNVRNPNLSMALGSGDTRLIDITTAFARLINGGKKVSPVLIDRVQDRDGKTIFKTDMRECPDCFAPEFVDGMLPPDLPDLREQLADAASVYQMVNMMQGAVEHGSGWRARITGRTIAGKTGTSNDSRDVWFIGGTPDLVVGVFMGHDQPRSLGQNVHGGSHAAPVFREFMERALVGVKDVAFRVPEGITFVRINRNTGRLATASDLPRDIISEAFKIGTEPRVGTPSGVRSGFINNDEGGGAINIEGIF